MDPKFLAAARRYSAVVVCNILREINTADRETESRMDGELR